MSYYVHPGYSSPHLSLAILRVVPLRVMLQPRVYLINCMRRHGIAALFFESSTQGGRTPANGILVPFSASFPRSRAMHSDVARRRANSPSNGRQDGLDPVVILGQKLIPQGKEGMGDRSSISGAGFDIG